MEIEVKQIDGKFIPILDIEENKTQLWEPEDWDIIKLLRG